ncbi:MAG: RraA family protein [Cyclobacteriaceae bacterium]|nr:RraA family protein [Cyclobacteriaceae bacterium]UYN85744.1 MAG: RraA family protein [Cyclobacteriaceae bacterium]
MKLTRALFFTLLSVAYSQLAAQQLSKEELIFLTPEWRGERFPDGRPKVSDDILKRMKLVTLEEAWATCRGVGYNYQYEGNWIQIHPDGVLVGRALTATFFPGRPDIHKVIQDKGHKDGRVLAPNAWAIDMLQPGDVYVVDHHDALIDGPTIGDNLGNSIFARSGNGIVYDGPVRDINGLKEIKGFTSYIRTYHPSHHFGYIGSGDGSMRLNTTLVGINTITRIGSATVMPGDVVLGRDGGVIFIPPHLAQRVVETSEIVRLRDMFGHQRLREKKYTAGQIDSRWTDEIEKDFSQWLKDNKTKLPVPPERVEELLKTRTW